MAAMSVYLLNLSLTCDAFSQTLILSSVYCHVLQMTVNHSGNPSCDKHMYQPYIEY